MSIVGHHTDVAGYDDLGGASSSLPAKYLRAVQQLRRKSEQLDDVFNEARRLEQENEKLATKNRELEEHVATLRGQVAHGASDLQHLEQQVKSQQEKLQQFIDQETNAALARLANQATAKRPPPPAALAASAAEVASLRDTVAKQRAEMESLKKALASLDESRAAAAGAADTFKQIATVLQDDHATLQQEEQKHRQEHARQAAALQERVQELESSNAALKEVLRQLRDKQLAVVQEAQQLENADAKVKEGLQAEYDTLRLEVRRLNERIEADRTAEQLLRSELHESEQQIAATRRFADEQTDSFVREIAQLHSENESLLADLKALVAERDTLRDAVRARVSLAHHRADAMDALSIARSVASDAASYYAEGGPNNPQDRSTLWAVPSTPNANQRRTGSARAAYDRGIQCTMFDIDGESLAWETERRQLEDRIEELSQSLVASYEGVEAVNTLDEGSKPVASATARVSTPLGLVPDARNGANEPAPQDVPPRLSGYSLSQEAQVSLLLERLRAAEAELTTQRLRHERDVLRMQVQFEQRQAQATAAPPPPAATSSRSGSAALDAHATALEKLLGGRRDSADAASLLHRVPEGAGAPEAFEFLERIRDPLYEVLLLANDVYHSLRAVLSPAEDEDRADPIYAAPTIPVCTMYDSQLLNDIESACGALRHLLRAMRFDLHAARASRHRPSPAAVGIVRLRPSRGEADHTGGEGQYARFYPDTTAAASQDSRRTGGLQGSKNESDDEEPAATTATTSGRQPPTRHQQRSTRQAADDDDAEMDKLMSALSGSLRQRSAMSTSSTQRKQLHTNAGNERPIAPADSTAEGANSAVPLQLDAPPVATGSRPARVSAVISSVTNRDAEDLSARGGISDERPTPTGHARRLRSPTRPQVVTTASGPSGRDDVLQQMLAESEALLHACDEALPPLPTSRR